MLVSVCDCVCCAGSGHCDELITRTEESYKVCVCVYVLLCVVQEPENDAAYARFDLLRHINKNCSTVTKLYNKNCTEMYRFSNT